MAFERFIFRLDEQIRISWSVRDIDDYIPNFDGWRGRILLLEDMADRRSQVSIEMGERWAT